MALGILIGLELPKKQGLLLTSVILQNEKESP